MKASGSVEHIYISAAHNFVGHHGRPAGTTPVQEVSSVRCVAGRGLEGDRYFDRPKDHKGQITFFAGEVWDALYEIISDSIDRGDWPAAMTRTLAWYEPILTARYDDANSRLGDIAQLERIAATYGSRDTFLTDLTLDPPQSTSDNNVPPTKDDDFVILSTIHSAKGQEWRNVFVLNVSEGSMPADLGVGSNEDIEEERRLLYVAMTRAKDTLHLTVPQRFHVPQQRKNGDKHVYGGRSRFLPKHILSCFEEVSWPPPALEQTNACPALPALDLAKRASARWGNPGQ